MSEFNGTPRPWKVIEREVMEDGSVYPRHIVGGDAEYQVCPLESSDAAKLAIDEPAGFWATNTRAASDAKLIAAAPELFEALNMIHLSFAGGNVITFSDRDIEHIGAAIVKATGA